MKITKVLEGLKNITSWRNSVWKSQKQVRNCIFYLFFSIFL